MNEAKTKTKAVRGAVLVTGASTGIGRATAELLAREGYRVFAGVRREEDAADIRERAAVNVAQGRLEPIILDVTDRASVTAAAAKLQEALGESGLAGLINNAGIVVAAPLEFVPLDDFEMQMRVNVTGVVAVTQAFTESLRRARGRIVNIGSISGKFSIPLMGPYSASKFALEAISDALRLELHPWGIEVSLLEPGPVATPLWEKSRRRSDAIAAGADPRGQWLYGPAIESINRMTAVAEKQAIDVQIVARTVLEALTARRPKTRYPLGPHVALRIHLRRWLPDRWVDALLRKAMNIP